MDGAEALQRDRCQRSRTVEQDLVADLRLGWAEGDYGPAFALGGGLGCAVADGGFDGWEAGEFGALVEGWGDLLVGKRFGVGFGGVAGGGVFRPVRPGGTVTR